jgi:surface polysaccharide O-acyltransferase-like enzyme
MSEKKVRYANLDLLKGIAMLLVITLHLPLWRTDYYETGNVSRMIQYAFRLLSEGVPVFLMINGMLIIPRKHLDLKEHYKKTFRIFLVMLAWEVIYTVSYILVTGCEKLNYKVVVNAVLTTAVGSKYTGLFWFLQGLIALYIIYPVIRLVYQTSYKYYCCLFAFLAGSRILYFLAAELGPISQRYMINDNWIVNIPGWVNQFQMVPIEAAKADYLLFFMMGGVVMHEIKRIQAHRHIWALAGLLAWILAICYGFFRTNFDRQLYNPAFNYASVFMLVMLVGWLASTFWFQDRGNAFNRFVTSVGKNTLGIYAVHQILIKFYEYFRCINSSRVDMGKVQDIWELSDQYLKLAPDFTERLLTILAVFLISWLITLLFRKIPLLHYLVEL